MTTQEKVEAIRRCEPMQKLQAWLDAQPEGDDMAVSISFTMVPLPPLVGEPYTVDVYRTGATSPWPQRWNNCT